MSGNRRAWEYTNCLLVWDGEPRDYRANVNGREVRGVRAALNLYGQNGCELVAFTPEEWHAPTPSSGRRPAPRSAGCCSIAPC